MHALATLGLVGPNDLPTGCGGLSMTYANAEAERECRRLSDLDEAERAAADPEIASEALGYDVEPGAYDHQEAVTEIMRAHGWEE